MTSKAWTRENVTINKETHQSVDQWFATLIGSRTPIRVCKKHVSMTFEFFEISRHSNLQGRDAHIGHA